MINRFQSAVLYLERADMPLVLGFMDLRQDPVRWDARG
jgi:hypothetical protein